MQKNPLSLLGLAKKAGMIKSGEDAILQGLQKREVKYVFIAKDASPKTIDKFERKCYFYKVSCCMDYTAEELSSAIGQWRKCIAIIDQGFAEAFLKYKR